MNTTLSLLTALLVTLVSLANATAVEDKKDDKSSLPVNAEWELKAFHSLFRVVKTDYDNSTKQVKWTVETREGQRTSNFLSAMARKPFTFHFLDGNGKELATVQLNKDDFEGVPKARLMKERTRLTITLDVPKAMSRTKKVLLQRDPS